MAEAVTVRSGTIEATPSSQKLCFPCVNWRRISQENWPNYCYTSLTYSMRHGLLVICHGPVISAFRSHPEEHLQLFDPRRVLELVNTRYAAGQLRSLQSRSACSASAVYDPRRSRSGKMTVIDRRYSPCEA